MFAYAAELLPLLEAVNDFGQINAFKNGNCVHTKSMIMDMGTSRTKVQVSRIRLF